MTPRTGVSTLRLNVTLEIPDVAAAAFGMAVCGQDPPAICHRLKGVHNGPARDKRVRIQTDVGADIDHNTARAHEPCHEPEFWLK